MGGLSLMSEMSMFTITVEDMEGVPLSKALSPLPSPCFSHPYSLHLLPPILSQRFGSVAPAAVRSPQAAADVVPADGVEHDTLNLASSEEDQWADGPRDPHVVRNGAWVVWCRSWARFPDAEHRRRHL